MFYLMTHSIRLFGFRHIIYRERKPTASTTWATLFDLQQGFYYMYHPTDRIAHTTTSHGALAETRNSSMGPP